jgi:hypothetical protein
MFAPKTAPNAVAKTCRTLAIAGSDKFDGFGAEFSARHPAVASLLSREFDAATASHRAILDGKPHGPDVGRNQMAALDRARNVFRTESITAGVMGDEAGATMIQAADLLAISAHASGGNVLNGEAAATLAHVSREREVAEGKLNKLGKLARGESIINTDDKLLVSFLHIGGVAGVIGGGISMIVGDMQPSNLAAVGLGCLALVLGRIALNQARYFALDSLR